MWTKEQNLSPAGSLTPSKPSAQPVASPASFAATPGTYSLIGETMRIQGQVSSREEMHVNGEVDGRLEVDHRLIVGPQGKAQATIKATEVVISGSVRGNVEAIERIVLRKGANLVGDVKTAGIVIEDGAYFKGGIDITRPGA